MRAYYGRSLEAPHEELLVVAATRQAALEFLAEEGIVVDERRLVPFKEAAVVTFQTRAGGRAADAEELRFDGALPDLA